ncbi:hypothetical protein [Corynebacterium camporealensis]
MQSTPLLVGVILYLLVEKRYLKDDEPQVEEDSDHHLIPEENEVEPLSNEDVEADKK